MGTQLKARDLAPGMAYDAEPVIQWSMNLEGMEPETIEEMQVELASAQERLFEIEHVVHEDEDTVVIFGTDGIYAVPADMPVAVPLVGADAPGAQR